MKHAMRTLLVLAATGAAVLAITAAPSSAGVTPNELTNAGWTCVRPLADPTRLICAPPGLGLPPLPGTPGFADRGPSYELLVFSFATGEFIGTQHLLRPDIYLRGHAAVVASSPVGSTSTSRGTTPGLASELSRRAGAFEHSRGGRRLAAPAFVSTRSAPAIPLFKGSSSTANCRYVDARCRFTVSTTQPAMTSASSSTRRQTSSRVMSYSLMDERRS